MLKNSETQYGAVTKSFHWITAVLVIGLLAVGLLMGDMHDSLAKIEVYDLHKSFGITVLLLMICRICWHIVSKKPGFVETLKPWEKTLATIVHYSLYVLLIAQPITGWLMSSAAGRSVHVFGLFTLPDLVGHDQVAAKIYRHRHGQIGDLIMIVLALHVAAALKHYFIDRDATLKRMLPCLFALLLIAAPARADSLPTWNWGVIQEKSSLIFKSTQLGKEFSGNFGRFAAYIVFNPDDLASSSVRVDIDISSAHTGTPDRDELIRDKDWFDVKNFPYARFQTIVFRKTGAESYVAEANLTIKNVTLPITLPFTLHIVKGDSDKGTIATMDGTLVLDRSKFGLGTSAQWGDTSIIANEVPVAIHIVARQNGT